MRGDFKEGLFELGLPLRCGGFGLVGCLSWAFH